MGKNLNAEQRRARAECYEEAAQHLELAWTDDPVEREQSHAVIRSLNAIAARWRSTR